MAERLSACADRSHGFFGVARNVHVMLNTGATLEDSTASFSVSNN